MQRHQTTPVEVYLFDLDGAFDELPAATGEERRAARALGHAGQSGRYLDSMRVLRACAGNAFGLDPADLVVSHRPNGKPVLSLATVALPVHVSLSRRDRWCAVGLARETAIGVDVELPRRYPFAEELAELLFPAEGRAGLAGLEGAAFDREFARWWTRIEAAVKASGATLDDARAALARSPQVAIEPAGLGGVVVAVATVGSEPQVRWTLPDETIRAVA